MNRFKQFAKFSLIWYSQQFAIPFWIVGHVHLHLNNYHDILEVLTSALMHITVCTGFWLDWKDQVKKTETDEV